MYHVLPTFLVNTNYLEFCKSKGVEQIPFHTNLFPFLGGGKQEEINIGHLDTFQSVPCKHFP